MTKWFTSVNGFNIEVEGSGSIDEIQPDSSSFDTYDEYDEGLEDDVFKFAFRNKINIKKY